MEQEIWRDIKGFEGLYQASSEGRIRSIDRIVDNSRYGKEKLKGRILKPYKAQDYYAVKMFLNGKGYPKRVSRIIYETFIGPIPEGMQVNHIDENKTNNSISNLNLMTPKENSNWGTRVRRANKKRKKPVMQYTLDGKELCYWFSGQDASKELNIDESGISGCLTGRRKTAGGYIWKYAQACTKKKEAF